MPFSSAAWLCHSDYQSESRQPYRILHAQEQAADRPHLTAGLFTRVYSNTHVHKHARTHRPPVVPTAPFSVHGGGSKRPAVVFPQCWWQGDQQNFSCVFILTKQGQLYRVCSEPSFPHLADIHALMRVQSSPIQSTCW